MKYLTLCTLGALLTAGLAGAAAARQEPVLKPGTPAGANATGATILAAPPCTLARSVTERLGRLAPPLQDLFGTESFAAENGELKVVVACGMPADEAFTYTRLLAGQGIGLINFRGDEPPQLVVQTLADRLKLTYRQTPRDGLPMTFLFPEAGTDGTGVRFTVQAPGSAPVTATPGDPVVGEDILQLYLAARAEDPDLGRARSRHLASLADTDVSRAGLRPRVNADFGVNYVDQSTYNSGPSALQSTVFGYNYDIVASAPILHFSTYYNLASAEAAERSDAAGVISSRQNLILRISEAYFGVLKSQGDYRIAREEISRVEQTLAQARAFLKAGTGDIIAVFEAQARLDSVLADLNRSESSLTLARQRLSSIVGRVVPSIAEHLPKKQRMPEPDDLSWWLSTMEKRDPQIRQAQEGLAGSIQQTKSAKADHLPVIDASGGFDVNKGAAYAPSVETHQWHVGATITVPLYSGGETSARVRRAGANETERRYALNQVLEQRRDNLKQSFFNLRYSVSLIRSLEQKEASALVQLNAVRKGRSIGTRTAIDLLNAEDAYSVAQRDLKNALYDNVVRMIELKAAAGTLSEQDLAD